MISFRKYIKTLEKELNFKKINMSELRSMFSKMKKSNSASYDTITMKTLNYVKSSIMPLILQLINTINQTKTFPECLKISRIIPIRKSFLVSALSMENYRPVNIISPLSKLVEKFWTRDILNHLKINKLVDQNHQGGYPKRTSTTTVLDIYQKLTNLKKNKINCALIQLDQSGAFDIVSHPILKSKLRHIGLSMDAVETIMSYLSNRKQYVRLNSNSSDLLLTGNVSVGQGSVVSGILYGIMTLDQNSQIHELRHTNHY